VLGKRQLGERFADEPAQPLQAGLGKNLHGSQERDYLVAAIKLVAALCERRIILGITAA
jgi:hypothetical protein